MRRTRIEKRERNRKGKMVNERTQAVCVSRRLAICVVFYDNYKYGRKALCLEQLVRLSKLCPYSPLPSFTEAIQALESKLLTHYSILYFIADLIFRTLGPRCTSRISNKIFITRLWLFRIRKETETVRSHVTASERSALIVGYLHVKISAEAFN